jgi:hypothetical protein
MRHPGPQGFYPHGPEDHPPEGRNCPRTPHAEMEHAHQSTAGHLLLAPFRLAPKKYGGAPYQEHPHHDLHRLYPSRTEASGLPPAPRQGFAASALEDPPTVFNRLYAIDSIGFFILRSGPTWPRTRDRPVMSRWLYQLSYGPSKTNPSSEPYIRRPSDSCQANSW